MGLRKEFRTIEWLGSFTGYVYQHAIEVLRRAGVDWRAASEAEIRRAVIANLNRARAVKTRKATPIEHGGRRWTVADFAALVGVEPRTMLARRSKYGWAKAVALSLATPGKWARGNVASERGARRGRPLMVETIDGETRTRREWLALVELTRQGLHNAARKHGRSASEELIDRVRARRSDAAHVAPASVASVQTPRMVRGDQRVSACAASGCGAANDNKQRGAA